MIAQPIGASWEYIGAAQGLFIPVKAHASVIGSALSLQFAGPTKAMGYYYAALVLFAVTLALMAVVERSKLGYYFRAIRDDQDAAEGIGIDSRLYKVIARSITAAVFAAAGVLYAFWALSVFPEQVLELNWSTLPIMATVVGGIGRLWGPVLGAVILIPISQIMSTTLGTGPFAGRGLDLIVYGVIIILIAAFRPTGLLSLPRARHRAHVAGRADVRPDDRARERHLRRAQAHQPREGGEDARGAPAGIQRARRQGDLAGGESHAGGQEAPRNRARARHRAPHAPARRGHVRAHPARDGRSCAAGA